MKEVVLEVRVLAFGSKHTNCRGDTGKCQYLFDNYCDLFGEKIEDFSQMGFERRLKQCESSQKRRKYKPRQKK